MKLLLFDVDLTLINSGGAGRRSMTRAFSELFGHGDGLCHVSFAGRTDPAIFREAVQQHGVAWTQDLEDDFRRRYLGHLTREIAIDDANKHIEPGVEALLETLLRRDDVTLALLTGNWRAGAKLKLEHFGLWQHFEFGAFADDAAVRSELPTVAAAKFSQRTRLDISPRQIYVVGETPLDVACAVPFGARAVAGARRFVDSAELKAANPDYFLTDLSDAKAFLGILEADR